MSTPQNITIPIQEYLELKRDSRELGCLYAAGVDNWEGYDWVDWGEDDE